MRNRINNQPAPVYPLSGAGFLYNSQNLIYFAADLCYNQCDKSQFPEDTLK